MYDEQIKFDEDKEKTPKQSAKKEEQIKKVIWFLVGWFTIPFITGGIWYDMFGGLSKMEVIHRLLHPKELLNALGIYTLTFIIFALLPDKYKKANIFLKVLYFIMLYILLKALINKFLW